MQRADTPFASLHGGHSSLNVAVIAVNLFLEILLALVQVSQSLGHGIDFLLTLESHPMFGTNVIGDCVENALISIFACDLSHFLQFEQEENSMRLDLAER